MWYVRVKRRGKIEDGDPAKFELGLHESAEWYYDIPPLDWKSDNVA